MTENIQESRIQLNKEYNNLLSEVKDAVSKTAAYFVPALCEALKSANPTISNHDIRNKVKGDCYGIWEYGTVSKYWPDWIKDPTKIALGKENAERKKYLQKMNATFKKIPSIKPEDWREPFHDDLYQSERIETVHWPPSVASLAEREGPSSVHEFVSYCEGLQRVIEEYFPRTAHEGPIANAKAIVDRWDYSDRIAGFNAIYHLKVHLDALYDVLNRSKDHGK